jgi:hypothetical protein
MWDETWIDRWAEWKVMATTLPNVKNTFKCDLQTASQTYALVSHLYGSTATTKWTSTVSVAQHTSHRVYEFEPFTHSPTHQWYGSLTVLPPLITCAQSSTPALCHCLLTFVSPQILSNIFHLNLGLPIVFLLPQFPLKYFRNYPSTIHSY